MKFGVVVKKDEDDNCVASVPELPIYHTQAKTLDIVVKESRRL
jgi:predicted RNase H-like HicB family nuclease